ncbi:UDP-glucose 4-epimerase GalE [Idiomarina seosinensis]|uniref:UDP-glucose 4-epimerase n=1 Tax=Idiomarina seosinensis TaxID=281739 RepID=A0A432ZGC0_9GAMM|nr:UDP-glucose 4-epimerase GalE [Idiomarina seosinensis]RUO76969.1 UDP-glucose 4-epimerase GalE [Idiomarina seosinensis]
MEKSILVTGGAGYIGSHTVVQLLEANYSVVVLDNLSNSSRESLKRVEKITGKQVIFIEGDILNKACLREVFSQYSIDSVIHFAGLKAVGESVEQPLSYYQNNVSGTLVLCEAMEEFGIKNIVFSSSATVYGDPDAIPIKERSPVGRTTNPYGTSKYIVELILKDLCNADSNWSAIVLRYFNPVGAHSSGVIGEDPNGIPNNLIPYISQVAIGKLKELKVYGNDYPTSDGTGVRDYIHVVDLARGHIEALKLMEKNTSVGFDAINLGTGQGYSVLEVIRAFEEQSTKTVPYSIVERRPGDIAECYADPEYAKKRLGWKAELGLKDMMRDSWNWQSNNPTGYRNR